MKVVLGLGNPGKRYQNNRHNIGFMVIDKLAEKFSLKLRRSIRVSASLAKKTFDGEEIILAKPLTFMNNSGAPLKRITQVYGVRVHDILIIYDDVDLGLGQLRFRRSGSAGGHKGMGSVITELNTQDIDRLRVGICRPDSQEVADYVLSDFAKNERPVVIGSIEKAVEASIDWLSSDIDSAMRIYNKCTS